MLAETTAPGTLCSRRVRNGSASTRPRSARGRVASASPLGSAIQGGLVLAVGVFGLVREARVVRLVKRLCATPAKHPEDGKPGLFVGKVGDESPELFFSQLIAVGAIHTIRKQAKTGGGRGKTSGQQKDGQRRPMFRRRKVCRFCAEKIDDINYKDTKLLMPFVPERAKILPRRISGTCAMHQRKLRTAIMRARQIALIPYTAE